MVRGSSEIVVLRPTTVFLSFLASQLPAEYVPTYKSLQTNNTAYIIKKHATNDATVGELAGLYRRMFRYEISRWLGENARNDIEKNFLDFLCCFELNFHSHLIVLEPSLQQAKQMLQLRPRLKLFLWLKTIAEECNELTTIMQNSTLANVGENSTLVLKNFPNLIDIKPFVHKYYKSLFVTAMSRICNQQELWPKMDTFEEFSHYFTVQIHTHLISYAV